MVTIDVITMTLNFPNCHVGTLFPTGRGVGKSDCGNGVRVTSYSHDHHVICAGTVVVKNFDHPAECLVHRWISLLAFRSFSLFFF